MKKKILVIDDDEKLTRLLSEYLSTFGFSVTCANHPDEGLNQVQYQKPDLVVLDIMLPDKDGFEVCRLIRNQSAVPVIMLTARGDLTDKVVGLELGADDYLSKPFEPRELVARIQTVLRRGGKRFEKGIFKTDSLYVDLDKHEVKIGDETIDITSTEFELLELFIKNAGKVLSRDTIMESVRGIEWESYNRSVDVLVSRLRNKLKDDPKHPHYLKTIWGTGYLFLAQQQ